MIKPKSLIVRIKSFLIPSCILLFIFFLLFFSSTNLTSVKKGLELWSNSVVPSLFPFIIATELLGYTNIVYFLGQLLNKFMKPLFNVPGEGSFPYIMGMISGYPIGAKIVSNLKKENIITDIEAERLISFTNNSGPLFIIGTIGLTFFKNTNIGILLFITHILASLSVGFIFRWWKYYNEKSVKKDLNFIHSQRFITLSNLGEILSSSIMNAINTMFLIGGYIVLFCVIINILESSHILSILSVFLNQILDYLKIPTCFSNGIISAILEITNGTFKISQFSSNYNFESIIICSFLLGFGGICITLQILSIISKAQISIKPYLIGKLLQGILAAVYTFLFIKYLGFFIF